jgi:oligopeptide/dipeptide ABC transporter ATP-binding protein
MNPTNKITKSTIRVKDLKVHFRIRNGILSSHTVRAVDGVSFDIHPGETLGIAGESGSGKSTVARTMIRINDPSSGVVEIDGNDITNLSGKELKRFRQKMQMVYQDPYDSLDPRMRVGQAIQEALSVQGIPKSEHTQIISALLERVRLPATLASRYPGQLSGGQRQRISIARALAVNPDVIICDEAVAALDASIRAQILNLLKDIQDELGVSYLFISHDLSTLRFMADRVAIMYVGKIVEYGTRSQVLENPGHPYTQALLEAVPRMHGKKIQIRLGGEPPDSANPPPGCPFHPRCPVAIDRCRSEKPLLEKKITGQSVACHLVAVSASAVSLGESL